MDRQQQPTSFDSLYAETDWQDNLRVECLPALERLYRIACRTSGQSHHVRRILLAVYNADEWPLDLGRLRALDTEIMLDALTVIRWFALSNREIHHFLDAGDAKMKALWDRER